MSNDTILDRVFVPDEATTLVCPAGFAGAGLFQVALFAWALLGFAGVYSSIARRAFDDVVGRMHERTSVALSRPMAYHPEVQHHIAEMRIHLEAMTAHLDRVCEDWITGVDHGMDGPVNEAHRVLADPPASDGDALEPDLTSIPSSPWRIHSPLGISNDWIWKDHQMAHSAPVLRRLEPRHMDVAS
jgi:alkylation response protein AidB-like acyl-CoA dehydrogenase